MHQIHYLLNCNIGYFKMTWGHTFFFFIILCSEIWMTSVTTFLLGEKVSLIINHVNTKIFSIFSSVFFKILSLFNHTLFTQLYNLMFIEWSNEVMTAIWLFFGQVTTLGVTSTWEGRGLRWVSPRPIYLVRTRT